MDQPPAPNKFAIKRLIVQVEREILDPETGLVVNTMLEKPILLFEADFDKPVRAWLEKVQGLFGR